MNTNVWIIYVDFFFFSFCVVCDDVTVYFTVYFKPKKRKKKVDGLHDNFRPASIYLYLSMNISFNIYEYLIFNIDAIEISLFV